MNVISAHLKVTHVKIQIETYTATNTNLYLPSKHLVPLFVRVMPQDVNYAILKCGLKVVGIAGGASSLKGIILNDAEPYL